MFPRLWLLIALAVSAFPVSAADPCPLLRARIGAPEIATRIAAYACKENQNWYRSFIDADGRSGGIAVHEAENVGLADGVEAWRHVAMYWNQTGLLPPGRAGAMDCAHAASVADPPPACRAFVVDTPWSAAFVSWVMRMVGLPGFHASGSHVDYVRQAYREPSGSPYLVQEPRSGKPQAGDMLCSVRANDRPYGFGDLMAILALPNPERLAMHCDIVVGLAPGRQAYLVGGNVQQAVTLRLLRLAPNGHFANLPIRSADDPECSIDAPAGCDLNRANWAVLLKLKSAAELAKLPPPPPPLMQPAPASQCCVYCVLGSGVPRCPLPATPATGFSPPDGG